MRHRRRKLANRDRTLSLPFRPKVPQAGVAQHMARSVLDCITLDCADPQRLAAFWAAVLGYVRQEEAEGGVVVRPVEGGGPILGFQPVPGPKTCKTRVHLDVRARGGATLEEEKTRLVGLGRGTFGSSPTGPATRTGSCRTRTGMSFVWSSRSRVGNDRSAIGKRACITSAHSVEPLELSLTSATELFVVAQGLYVYARRQHKCQPTRALAMTVHRRCGRTVMARAMRA